MSKAGWSDRRDSANPDDNLLERICEDDDFIGAFIRNRNEIYAPDEDGSGVIRMLLDGYLDLDERGLVQKEYLKGRAEFVAQAMLSDMLREDRVPPELRGVLADLLDPASDNERILKFSFRRRGNRSAHEAHVQMKMMFEKLRSTGKTATAAIEAIVERFVVDESTVKKALSRTRGGRANVAAARGNK